MADVSDIFNKAPIQRTSLADQLGSGANLAFKLGDLYKDYAAQQMQQQAYDYMYPKEMYMSPSMVGGVYNAPINAMEYAYSSAKKKAAEAGQDAKTYPVIDYMGRPVKTSEADVVEDQDRVPAQAQGFEAYKNIMEDFKTGTMAKRMGLSIDPATGAIKGPGRQVKEYYDMLDKVMQAQAQIFAASARPQYEPAPRVLPAPRAPSRGNAKDPIQEIIDQNLKRMSSILKESGIAGQVGGPEKIKSQALRDEYMALQSANAKLMQQRAGGMAPQQNASPQQQPQWSPGMPPPPGFKVQTNAKTGAKRLVPIK
jgi:hypothetical protein